MWKVPAVADQLLARRWERSVRIIGEDPRGQLRPAGKRTVAVFSFRRSPPPPSFALATA
jgi:hypothetical protein